MLSILRFIVVVIYSILVCVFGCIWCLFSPRNPRHVATFGHLFGKLSTVFGLKVELRRPEGADNYPNAIYIANHQNNYDMITAAKIVQPTTVTVGKKTLLWVPFFGLLYWLTGNLLIDRDNRSKAHGTIGELVDQFKKKKISFWMFPEGTRSRGRGLLPFKTGAFHAAMAAGVPIIPIVVSNTHDKIKLNRLNNGHVIIEMLPPVDTAAFADQSVRKLATHCRELMMAKLDELNAEVAAREAADKR
ncbi:MULTISPECIES: 1-acylglycerol-3-phosphate O-acyltransferase [Erwinia]|jgi:1-acyl-sn-glycerol-3-phosphate acyltransferase|uniref:1-acyl-sn-glycerol-3-phosphate acyltransferase n=1 Tax=Erwinia billingiae (strain Eb661) TaxID=634500 RepID=D8MX04_ERWBE|nr:MULTISPECIES: 1-acylglycerol-3-phosphate O-acyltransferase [Erwinia]MBN7122215.1 1-acyl-sn-glycerol-3-phosphate acyltransferase [Erwinia billingiae]PRB59545.1 1-acyl-sn-glycerol-3-phosphate acyltransferase [Erwinia billingiae]QBR49129.1 1-acylglycerol-3-phosphate O-acyltransferase [Erwinia sp. QL-Z3]QEW30784.1 1-acylglycerol-3-phosphate O-acyltransferase [Erwinia billingiae]CAX61361.1 1-acyl-sn-glycerol-3-phosphate acyltransferase [Erwinia billingiae Eb661]